MRWPWGTKARAPVARWPLGVAGAGEAPRGYEAQVRAAFLDNPVAQRAVRTIAEAAASAVIEASEAEVQALLARPNAGQDGAGLIEAVASHLLLHGNAWIEPVTGPGGRPAALYALRPERVRVEGEGAVHRAGGRETRWAADGLIHLRMFHPLDDQYGLGCLGACAQAVAVHNAAGRWNKTLLDNAARPSGALSMDGGELAGAQFDRLRAELDAMFSGAGNAGRPLLLEGGLKWQPLSLTPAEMDFAGLKAAAARDIALAFGVPPMLLGLPGDSTYANYREAGVALWRLTVLPLLARICGGIEARLGDWWPGLTLSVDLDRVPALSADREKLWRQVSAADFLTREEKRAAVGY